MREESVGEATAGEWGERAERVRRLYRGVATHSLGASGITVMTDLPSHVRVVFLGSSETYPAFSRQVDTVVQGEWFF
jgi:hypothetical protein